MQIRLRGRHPQSELKVLVRTPEEREVLRIVLKGVERGLSEAQAAAAGKEGPWKNPKQRRRYGLLAYAVGKQVQLHNWLSKEVGAERGERQFLILFREGLRQMCMAGGTGWNERHEGHGGLQQWASRRDISGQTRHISPIEIAGLANTGTLNIGHTGVEDVLEGLKLEEEFGAHLLAVVTGKEQGPEADRLQRAIREAAKAGQEDGLAVYETA